MDERLLRAVYRQNERDLRALLQEGVDLHARDEDGRNALMHAVLASDADAAWVKLLLQEGLDPNEADGGQRWTALHFAARDRKPAIIRALLEMGADVDARDVFGNTPLWRAVMSRPQDEKVEELLLDAGADPDAQNDSGVSPRLLAERLGRRIDFSRRRTR